MRGQVRLMGMCVDGQARDAGARRQWASLCAVLGGLILLGGCSGVQRFYDSKLPFDTPVDWWHQLQGGAIAEERPPPPGVGSPYPNLGEIPQKPTPPDAVARRALSARLAQERDRTDRADAQEPIPSLKPARPAGAPAATPAPAAAPMATIEAAQAKPAPVVTAAAPAGPPPAAAISAAASPTPPPRRPVPGAPVASGPVPPLPAAPPAFPSVAGAVPPPPPAATARPAPQIAADFVGESAVLRPESDAALRQMARNRFSGTVLVLGGGDATSARPDDQAAALPLAWRRARAMQDVLKASGVPSSAMRVDAAALARGGTARLVD